MTNYIRNLVETRPNNDSYKYMLLDRMKQDCKYYLGYGNHCPKCLWSGDEKEHIEDMKALWESFSPSGKPEWTK